MENKDQSSQQNELQENVTMDIDGPPLVEVATEQPNQETKKQKLEEGNG